MTASPGDGEHAAREGYYPDPSIPGYVRYWNGASWVPGTSRPAAAVSTAVRVEETGPVFLDDTSMTEALRDPGPTPWGSAGHGDAGAARLRDSAPGPAWGGTPQAGAGPDRPGADARDWGSDPGPGRGPGGGGAGAEPGRGPGGGGAGRGPGGWQVDPVHQAGFGGPRDARVSWGDPAEPEREPGRPAGISLARPAAAATAQRLPAQAAESVGILSARPPAWPDAPGAGTSGLTSSWPEATPEAPPQQPQPHPATVRRTPEPAPAPERRAPEAGRTPDPVSAPDPEPRDAGSVRAPAPERRAPEPAPAPERVPDRERR
ncbi:DUF2510 domain-containing protein, partial [Streptomyces katrae]